LVLPRSFMTTASPSNPDLSVPPRHQRESVMTISALGFPADKRTVLPEISSGGTERLVRTFKVRAGRRARRGLARGLGQLRLFPGAGREGRPGRPACGGPRPVRPVDNARVALLTKV